MEQKKKNQKKYEAPSLTVVSFMMEHGYQVSGGTKALAFGETNSAQGDYNLEGRSEVEYSLTGENDGWI